MKVICWKDKRGSFTVEAAFVFSAVIMSISLLCVAFMLLYHQMVLNKAASSIAQKAALMWVDSKWNRSSDARQEDLYYRIVNDGLLQNQTYTSVLGKERELTEKAAGLVEQKLAKITEVAQMELRKFIKKPQDTTIVVNYNNQFFSRELSVEIVQRVRTPFSAITLTAKESAQVVEPLEYIRNIDLIFEYVEKGKDFDLDKVRTTLQREARVKK